MKVAVVSDATSPDFTFPLWHKYYSALFGEENLFVLTYAGADSGFEKFALGGLERLGAAYNDDFRLTAVAEIVASLLERYEAVVRIDVDEFLVVDPRKHTDLGAYLRGGFGGDFVTARGFDIIPGPDDPPIDLTRAILPQRQLAFALWSMNKTCIVRRPMTWGRGFHYCSAPPAFDDVFLFHLKRIDLVRQTGWAARMADLAEEASFEKLYYQQDLIIAENFVKDRWRRKCAEGEHALIRTDFCARFERAVGRNEANGLFEGGYEIEEDNVAIPARFATLF